MVAGVDVRGGGPGTRETDLLAPTASVERITAITLTGGSAYGLAAADGVMTALADRGLGLTVGPLAGQIVPLVPAAVLFDLGRGGRFRSTPGPDRRALPRSPPPSTIRSGPLDGCIGAGTGAVVAGLKGGVGSASVVLPDGTTIAAMVVVNAIGSPVDLRTGELLAGRLLLPGDADGLRRPSETELAALRPGRHPAAPSAGRAARRGAGGRGRGRRAEHHHRRHRHRRHADQGPVHQTRRRRPRRPGPVARAGARDVRRRHALRRVHRGTERRPTRSPITTSSAPHRPWSPGRSPGRCSPRAR